MKLVIAIAIIIVVLFLSLSLSSTKIVTTKVTDGSNPITMELGVYQDSDCGMVIDSLEYASQVISDNKAWFFHDHGGMVKWLDTKEFKTTATIWVMSRDTHEWIDGRVAFYSDDELTPMEYGFGAYRDKKDNFIDFKEMSLRVLRGETLQNPIIKKQKYHGNN
ncbi:MAG: hypothetical protein WC144_07600 [Sulfurimonas sp.]|jgi:hypothetical protein|nr:hypothetical protein [Sulfurimonadaceae bacterium]